MLGYAVSIKYMLAGYSVILIVMLGYILCLFFRWRSLQRDLFSMDQGKEKE